MLNFNPEFIQNAKLQLLCLEINPMMYVWFSTLF